VRHLQREWWRPESLGACLCGEPLVVRITMQYKSRRVAKYEWSDETKVQHVDCFECVAECATGACGLCVARSSTELGSRFRSSYARRTIESHVDEIFRDAQEGKVSILSSDRESEAGEVGPAARAMAGEKL